MLNIILKPDDKPSLVFAGNLEDRLYRSGIQYQRHYLEHGRAFYATKGLWLPLGDVAFEAVDFAKVVEDRHWTSIAQTVSDKIKELESKVVLVVGRGLTVGSPLVSIAMKETNAQIIVVNSYVARRDYVKLLCCADTVVFATSGYKENSDLYGDKIVIDVSYPRAFNNDLPCRELYSKEITSKSMDALVKRIAELEA